MRHRFVGKWLPVGLAALCAVLVGGDRGTLHANDKPDGSRPWVSDARALVKSLEARARSAQADLDKAKALLATLDPAPPSPVAEKDDTDSVEGVWRIVGISGNFNNGEFRKPPYDEYKIMSAGHYLWLSFNPENGAVIRSGGGTYTLKGDAYTAHVDYSIAGDLQAVASQEYTGTSRLEGKKLYHFGTMTNGAMFDELWERVH